MKRIFAALALIISVQSFAQQVGVGQWRDHLSYTQGTSVASAGTRVYVAAGNGVFYINLQDKSINRISKITGLSDVGAKIVRYSKEYKTVFIGYDNGNIDLIVNENTIENYSDIKRATSIFGNKTINDVMFIDSKAYISTNFGISVFDLIAKEFKETYIIGPNGSNLNVNGTATDGQFIYAATASGVYKASLNNPNLVDYNNWSVITDIPHTDTTVYNAICYVHNKLYVNQSNTEFARDTSYVLSNGVWQLRDPLFTWSTTSLRASGNYMVLTAPYVGTWVYDENGVLKTALTGNDIGGLSAQDAEFDELNNLWVADKNYGAACTYGPFGTNRFTPDGPVQNKVLSMVHRNGNLWTVPGGTLYFETQYSPGQVSRYNGTTWENRTNSTDPVLSQSWDYMNIAVDPANANHAYFSSWGRGVIEFKDNQFYRYDINNSDGTIKSHPQDTSMRYVGGICYEGSKVWFGNSFNSQGIISRNANGTFQAYNFGALLGNNRFFGQIYVNSLGQKWCVLGRGNGILVFKEKADGTIPTSNRRILTNAAGNGALPDAEVRCVVEDKDGLMWVGTANGVCIFYNPSAILDGSNNFDAQKPGLVEDGFFYALLENEKVTCIAVDGANRKWIGTEKGGLFLVSADGSQQIKAFNTDNSLLLSNSIICLAIDPVSGEVFIGTDLGIVSYRGDATEAGDKHEDEVYAFPNPVKPGYTGPIAIKGLVRDADVKITDIAGRVVFQTRANGGTATWNGTGFDGERAKTGVYLVFTTNEDGLQTNVAKIMLVN